MLRFPCLPNKIFFILLIAIFHSEIVSGAATTANYSFQSLTNGSFATDKNGGALDMSSGTTLLYGPNTDAYTASQWNMGFQFYMLGINESFFSVNPDGQFQLGGTITGHTQSTSSFNYIIPVVNTDNKTGPTGKVHFKKFGTSPNSILVVEWKDIIISANNSSNDLSTFQLRLYETGGVIEMVYGNMFNTSSNALDLSLGFGFGSALGSVGCVNNITTVPAFNAATTTFISTSTPALSPINILNSPLANNRTIFRFTPNIPATPTNLTFTFVGLTTMQLNWTDNSNNELFYRIYRSTDGINYTLVRTSPANTTIFSAGNLSPNTTYYWRIGTTYEGGPSPQFLSGSQVTYCGMSGVIPVPGPFGTLFNTISNIQANGVAGPVILELQSNYNSANDGFPYPLKTYPCMSAVNTVTIRPAPGVTGLVLSSSNSEGTFKFDGGKYWIIDGRPGGVGNQKELTIKNTNTDGIAGTGSAVTFVGSTDNIIKYVKLSSTYCTTLSGVITLAFGGNNNNLIDNCDIDCNAGNNLDPINTSAAYGIISTGSCTFNTISNCNIYNFYGHNIASAGISLATGSTDWTISNNHFYQTGARSSNSSTSGINIPTAKNCKILNNYIGGSAVNAGGLPWTTFGGNQPFIAIKCISGASDTVSIQGNVITNFDLSSSNTDVFEGISCGSGIYNIGNITGNIIGSSSATNKIVLSYTGTTIGNSNGIIINPSPWGTVNLYNNIIGGISLLTDAQNKSHEFLGISGMGNTVNIKNNIVGSPVTANSISLASTNNSQNITGIYAFANAYSITGNLVSNITNNFAPVNSTYQAVCGITTLIGTGNIDSNKVCKLKTGANSTGIGINSSVIGICSKPSSTSSPVSNNIVYALNNTNLSNAVSVIGIYSHFGGPENANFIHSLQVSSPTASITGLYANNFTNVQNNMIRLGIDTAGNSIQTPCTIFGIVEKLVNGGFYHNTVYIGGSGVENSASNSYAFYSEQFSNPRQYTNNIFVNERSNADIGGKHYAIRMGDNTNGFYTMDYNIYRASGNGGVLAYFNGDYLTLPDFAIATGKDVHSLSADPCLVSPTSGIPNLHLTNCSNMGNPAEGNGSSGITTDFDNELRASLTPTDIGADAGNYQNTKDLSVIEIVAPKDNSCHSSSEMIIVKVRNNGTPLSFSQSPFDVHVNVTGAGSMSFAQFINGGRSPYFLATGDTYTVAITTLNTLPHGVYHIEASVNLQSDGNPANNILQETFTSNFGSINITGEPGIFMDSTTVLTAIHTNGADTIIGYQWSHNNNIIGTNAIVTISDTGTYNVIATNTYGCTTSSSTYIRLKDSLSVTFKMFLEGYYAGNGLMDNYGAGGCLFVNGISPNPTDCDTVQISIMKNVFPYSEVDHRTGILNTSGIITLRFSGDVYSGIPYYIKVNHRNSIETWSSAAILLQQNYFHNFTNSISKAFGNNLKNLGDGNFALYSGDINNDGVIEAEDYLNMENAVNAILLGYIPTDITGDGIVESLDYLIMENNVGSIISVLKP